MATVDAVMADKRAADIINKYRDRDWGGGPGNFDQALLHEMQQDIANAINAAIAEVLGRHPLEPEPDKFGKDEPGLRTSRPAATHMPATGHDKPSARK